MTALPAPRRRSRAERLHLRAQLLLLRFRLKHQLLPLSESANPIYSGMIGNYFGCIFLTSYSRRNMEKVTKVSALRLLGTLIIEDPSLGQSDRLVMVLSGGCYTKTINIAPDQPVALPQRPGPAQTGAVAALRLAKAEFSMACIPPYPEPYGGHFCRANSTAFEELFKEASLP